MNIFHGFCNILYFFLYQASDGTGKIDISKSPSVKCIICHESVPLPMWNKHQDSCILEDNEQVLELEVKH